jgi:hypothetical protein
MLRGPLLSFEDESQNTRVVLVLIDNAMDTVVADKALLCAHRRTRHSIFP